MQNQNYGIQTLNTEINISTIHTLHYLELDPHYRNEGEKHTFWEMLYVISGNCTIVTDSGTHNMRSGDIIFHKPGEFHSLFCDKKSYTVVFVMSFDCKSRIMRYFSKQCFTLPIELIGTLRKIISESRKVFSYSSSDGIDFTFSVKKDAPIGSQQLIRLYLEQLLILLLQKQILNLPEINEYIPKEQYNSRIVSEIIKTMEASIYSKLDISEICKNLHYGRSYIYNIFKESTGMGINEYFNRMKIDEAKRLFNETNCSITEVSDTLSFSNPQYFTRVFKKYAHMTPLDYKHSRID